MRVAYACFIAFGAICTAALFAADPSDSLPPDHTKSAAALRAALDKSSHETNLHDRGAILLRAARDGVECAKNNIVVKETLQAAINAAKEDGGMEATVEQLATAIRQAAEVWEFTPTMEAKLPKGFPQPTPVGEIAVKRYPTYRSARTEMSTGRDGAFWTLFQHITTNKIEMTAPVEITYRAAPPTSDGKMQEQSMSFLYDNTAIGQLGEQRGVSVLDSTPRCVLSIGMRGEMTKKSIARGKDFLLRSLAEDYKHYEPAGELHIMGYNSPFVPVENRYFEVEIPIREKGGSAPIR